MRWQRAEPTLVSRMDSTFSEHEETRSAVIRDAVDAARSALERGGMAPGKMYCIYVPNNANTAITKTLDLCDFKEFAAHVYSRHRNILLVRSSETPTPSPDSERSGGAPS